MYTGEGCVSRTDLERFARGQVTDVRESEAIAGHLIECQQRYHCQQKMLDIRAVDAAANRTDCEPD